MRFAMKEFEHVTLPNGIQLVHKQITTTKLVHCGFVLDIGSRDEDLNEQGLAHFWEHMAFKGTKRRKAFHIINRLESVGGELNAYTSKEKICFYAAVLDRYFEKAFDLLTDITFDSVFPNNQIEREKKVILEEMTMYEDDPEDSIQDDFEDLVYKGHPLGRNILGTRSSVKSFKHSDFKNFISKVLNTEKIIFSSVGNVPFKKVIRLAEKLLSDIPSIKHNKRRKAFSNYKPSSKEIKKNIQQAHCAIGRDAPNLHSDSRLQFFMLNNILGGPGLNSRLNLALREKYGYVYSVESMYLPYIDTGLFAIYFGTDKKYLNRAIKLVRKELKQLKQKSLGTIQLHNAKEQLMGQLAMAEENNAALMLMMGKSLLDLNRIDSLDDIFNEIKKISANDLQGLSLGIFQEEFLSLLKFNPYE